MMEIETPTCFRSSAAHPRSSSTSALNLHIPSSRAFNLHSPVGNSINLFSPSSGSYPTSGSRYNFQRSNSYTGSMVVESQTHNFRPMTPDPHPDTAEKSQTQQTLDLSSNLNPKRQHTLTLPPEGALTPSPEPLSKKVRLSSDRDTDIQNAFNAFQSKCIENSIEFGMRQQQSDIIKSNGVFTNENDEQNDISHENENETSVSQDFSKQIEQRLNETMPLKTTKSLLEAAFGMDLDNSPPTLSPKTSDTDLDMASTGSPSINGERRRRKPNLEDIVRRMKEVETDYYSEDSDDEVMNNRSADCGDEVDGDIAVRMPLLSTQMGFVNSPTGQSKDAFEKSDFSVNDNNDEGLGNGPVDNNTINKLEKFENDNDKMLDEDRLKENGINEQDENGIPLPPSKSDSADIKRESNMTPPKTNGFLHGAFNGFPMGFPFQHNTPDLPFPPFGMNPFENKFSSPEVEKDYLKCQYCERTFRRQKNLENHVENTHHGKSPNRKKPGENGGDMYFKCTHCPYTTKHQSNLYVHLRIHTGKFCLPCLVLSCLVLSCLVSSRLVSSRLVSSRLVSSRLVSSRLVSSRLVSSRLVSSRLVSSRLVSSRLVSSRLVSSRLVSSCPVLSCPVMSCLVLLCLILCRLISCYIFLCHLIFVFFSFLSFFLS